MAVEVAFAAEGAEIAELESSGGLAGPDDGGGEVDEMRVVGGVSLGGGDAVGVVAGRARCAMIDDMATMTCERTIRKDAGTIVAGVAQCVGGGALARKIGGLVAGGEKRECVGPVRAVWT